MVVRRVFFSFIATLVLAGCALRSTDGEIRDVDESRLYCTWTKNNLTGSTSDARCVDLGDG